jgi:hypothetical protein
MFESSAPPRADRRLRRGHPMDFRFRAESRVQRPVHRRPATGCTTWSSYHDRAVPELGQVPHELRVALNAATTDGREMVGDDEDSGHWGRSREDVRSGSARTWRRPLGAALDSPHASDPRPACLPMPPRRVNAPPPLDLRFARTTMVLSMSCCPSRPARRRMLVGSPPGSWRTPWP